MVIQWNLDIKKGQGTDQNGFAIRRCHDIIAVPFHIFFYYYGWEYCLLYRGLC